MKKEREKFVVKWKVCITKTEKTVLILLSVIVFVVASLLLLFLRANQPMKVAEAQTTSIAKAAVGMEIPEKFYHFTRRETVYSVLGRDEKKQEVYVLVPENGEKALVFPKSEGITEKKANALVLEKERNLGEIVSTNLGIVQKQLVWEVTAKLEDDVFHYYLLDFKTGKLLSETTT